MDEFSVSRSDEDHAHEEHAHEEHAHEEHAHEEHAHEHDHAEAHGSHADHDHGPVDMHIWLDPQNGAAMAHAIAGFLADLDPANAERYRANATRMEADLTRLTAEVRESLVGANESAAVVFHDAFQYLEARFDLNIVGAITLNPEIPASARHVRELQELIASRNVACIFTEPQFQPHLVTMLVEESATRTATLDPIGASLTPGPELYGQLIRQNVEALVSCLSPA